MTMMVVVVITLCADTRSSSVGYTNSGDDDDDHGDDDVFFLRPCNSTVLPEAAVEQIRSPDYSLPLLDFNSPPGLLVRLPVTLMTSRAKPCDIHRSVFGRLL